MPKIVAESGSCTQVQVSPSRTRPRVAVKVMSSGPAVMVVSFGARLMRGGASTGMLRSCAFAGRLSRGVQADGAREGGMKWSG
ncbi:hypothetical protein GCM10027515_07010 [Schumannella luteola]